MLEFNQNKKICIVVRGLDSGGIENYLLRFLQFKSKAFSEIIIICKSGRVGQLEAEYNLIPNIRIMPRVIGFFNPLHYLSFLSYLKEQKFDVICDFTGNFAGPILWMAQKAGIPKRIALYRGASDHFKANWQKNLYNNWVKKLTYKYATNILSNSQTAFDYFFKEKIDKRFEVIYNGIDANSFILENDDLRRELHIPKDAFVIGHTGRYTYAKNHKTIFNVVIQLLNKYPHLYIILCGNGVKKNLQDEVDKLQLNKRFILSENRRDIPLFLNTMDAYFFPSVTEGQPNALIEAMLMGLPFAASNISPIKETVPHSHHSYLGDPTDDAFFVKQLSFFIEKKVGRDAKLRQFVLDHYDHEKLFNKFFSKF